MLLVPDAISFAGRGGTGRARTTSLGFTIYQGRSLLALDGNPVRRSPLNGFAEAEVAIPDAELFIPAYDLPNRSYRTISSSGFRDCGGLNLPPSVLVSS